ncbi:PAS domain S-box protein [Halapricum sp. CBA1109]|uniref:PAS domain S-box protein n=1 Tax=Halapricum sp. CBA1109 TaxID=2668068 RepID=UPI0012FCD23A|nr:PAS domain S-box protein [Halapricum sp. CBA1109]MUV88959.1 PAS domain S-box protein [Halapricum sp. CBA1109]
MIHVLSVAADDDARRVLDAALTTTDAAVTERSPDTAADAGAVDCLLWGCPIDERFAAVRRSHPDTPTVAVVPESCSDTLTTALDAGAADAVDAATLADHPTLLGQRLAGVLASETDLDTATAEAHPDPERHVADAVVQNFPNGAVTLVDRDLRYALAGGRLFDRLSVTPDDVVGAHVRAVGSGDRDQFVDSYEAALDGRETVVETVVEGRTLVHRTVPVTDGSGRVTSAVGMTQDVTERTRRESELSRNREFLREIQHVAAIGGWEVDDQSETLRLTDEVYRIYGLSPDQDLSLEDAIGFYHPDDRETVREAYERLLSAGESYDLELRIETADGDCRWIRTRGEPWTDDDGTQIGARGTFQDVTDRRERERELRRKSRAIEAAPIGITISDPSREDNPLIYANQQFHDRTGYSPEEAIGRNCRFLQGEDTDPETVARIRAAIDDERPVTAELRNYTRDGSMFWNQLEVAPVWDADGELLNYVGFQRDVTEQVEYERALEESRNRYRTLVENFPNGAVALVDADLRYTTVGGTPVEEAEATPDELRGAHVAEVLPDELAEVVVPHYTAALDGAPSSFEETIGDRIYQFRIVPVRADDGSVFAAMGVSQDVTEQRERARALEKRERILHQLHVASRESYPPTAEADVATFVVEFLENAFGFEYVSVSRFDEQDGVLRPQTRSLRVDDAPGASGVVSPGDSPLWDAYRTGDSRLVDPAAAGASLDLAADRILAVPIGDFGLIVVGDTDDEAFDDVDRELIEVVATNAEAVLQSLQREQARTELAGKLDEQEQALEQLRSIVETIRTLQRRIADSDSHDELEATVCDELLEADRVDFAWIGHPQTADTDLTATTWAGAGNAYLDAVLQDDAESLPARRAAADREPQRVSHIAEHVHEGDWAKEAMSAQFTAALSVPLVYDGVLYGVLSVYSRSDEGFDETYEELLDDVGSLVVTYSRILEQRYPGSNQEYTELVFDVADRTFPLQRLAAETDTEIRYDTVAETMDDAVRILVTVDEGDVGCVLDRARESPSVLDARRFGSGDGDQLSLTLERPFVAADIGKHGGELVGAVSDPTRTRLTVTLPRNVSTRPIFDALTTRFDDIEMAAQRQRSRRTETTTDDLTDRQLEVLNAAYHGGYYEMPRDVTGSDLAAAFDISGPAVSKHLRAAHRKVLTQFLDTRQ